jgi:NAD(P)-dependent dehydrogenase (short-subunit alcohol dehydrogenase family)
VTGVEQPIGAAIVHELATHGAACIYACTSSPESAALETYFSDLAADVGKSASKTKIIGHPLETASEPATLTLIDDILNAFGRLDVWVCYSAVLGPASITATTPADLQASFEANALAPFFALKYAPPAMGKLCSRGHYPNAAPKDVGYGSIVVVGSVAGDYGGCWGPCWTMSSHAALGVVRAGVAVLKGTGVRINCISPGQIDSGADLGKGMSGGLVQGINAQREQIGLERAATEVARVAGFLASGFSSYITGANLVVDGGAS